MIRNLRPTSFVTFVAGGVIGVSLFSLFQALLSSQQSISQRQGCSSWRIARETQVFGGNPEVATSVDDCKTACIAYPGCDGIDWVEDDPPGSQCWLSGPWITGKNEGTAYGVTHYTFVDLCPGRLVRKQGDAASRDHKQHYSNSHREDEPPEQIIDENTNQNSRMSKLSNVKIEHPNIHREKLKLKDSDLIIDENAIPNVNRNSKPFDCTPTWTWTKMPNTQVFGGKGTDATSLSACQSSCITFPGCTGVDWSPAFALGNKCWLSGNWSSDWSNGTAPGVTHYMLTNRCSTKESSDLEVTARNGCSRKLWKPIKHTQVLGGRSVKAETLRLCRDACTSVTGCNGIDWNPYEAADLRCWLSGDWILGWNNRSVTSVTHYALIKKC